MKPKTKSRNIKWKKKTYQWFSQWTYMNMCIERSIDETVYLVFVIYDNDNNRYELVGGGFPTFELAQDFAEKWAVDNL